MSTKERILRLRLRPELFAAVRCGQKRSTIRAGRKYIEPGLLVLESPEGSLLVRITRVTYKRCSGLTDEDARNDGYVNVSQLQKELRSIYPTLGKNSLLTLIEFGQVSGRDGIFQGSSFLWSNHQ